MKRVLAALALSALSAFGQQQQLDPGDYRNFYVPQDWKQPTVEGTLFYVDNKQVKTRSYTLTPDGNGGYTYDAACTGVSAETATKTALEAAVVAAKAYAEAKYAQASVDQFAKTLYQLLAVHGVTITDKSGDKMTIKFDNNSIGRAMQEARGGGNIAASTDSEFEDEPITDDKTIGVSSDQRLQIWGAESATAPAAHWWDDLGFFVPTLKGTGSVVWKKYGGCDANIFATESTSGGNKVLSLKDFYLSDNENVCQENLNQLLTETSSTQRNMHYIICRYDAGSSPTLHYLPIGGRLMGAAECDNLSITTNETYKFHIVGVGDAVSGQVLASDGRAGVDWVNPAPGVSYDGQDASFTISPGGNDDRGDTYVYLPYVDIEETESGYTFNWRRVNSDYGLEEDSVTIPKATNMVDDVTITLDESGQMQIKGYSDELDGNQYVGTDASGTWGVHGFADVRVDAHSIVTNAEEHVGEAAIAGFWDSETTDGMFPVKSGNTLSWVSTNATSSAFKVDTHSIVTNAEDHLGEAALAGFWDSGTADGMFPMKSGNALAWAQSLKLDDASITTNTQTGATTANTATLYGWKDAAVGALPSKATNGKLEWSSPDNATVSFNTLNGEKVLGLNAWNYNYSGSNPAFLANAGGQLAYFTIPLPLPPDHESIEAVSDGTTTNLQIKGWANQSACDASLMSMISQTGDENRGTHKILCRVDGENNTHTMHYLPIGLGAVIKPDGYSIVTNADDHAGEAAIAGFWDDETESGMFPVKSGDTIAWVPTNSVASNFKVDGYSIVTNETGHLGEAALPGFWDNSAAGDVLTRTNDGLAWAKPGVAVDDASICSNGNEIALYDFANAEENVMPHKEGGKLVWGGISAVTNTILAGAGIVITDNGGGAITISAEAMEEEDGNGSSFCSVTVITDARYDETSHKFQVKKRTLTFAGSMTDETAWQDVFEAVSHRAEHEGEYGGSGGGSVE